MKQLTIARRIEVFALAFACSILGACALWPFGPSLTYPAAPRGDTVDDYHGVTVADPYRGFEELDSPATTSWVSAESKLADRYLDGLPSRPAIRSRLEALTNFEKIGSPFHEDGRYFFTYNSGLQNHAVLMMTSELKAPAVVAFDPNQLSQDGSLNVVGYVASPEGGLLAYGVSDAGSDWTDWHIRDLATGTDLPDVLHFTKYYAPVFSEDGKGLYYSAFPAPQAGDELSTQDLGNALYYHVIGKPFVDDHKLLQDARHPDWQYAPHRSRHGRWLVVDVGEGEVGDKGVENVELLDLESKKAVFVPMTLGFDAAYIDIGEDKGLLYFVTTLDAPSGRIIAVDPRAPDRARWKELIPQGRDAIDVTGPSVTLVGHQLIVQTTHDAHSRVVIYGLDGLPLHELSLPGPGTVGGFTGDSDGAETFYSFSDPITPPTVYRYDLNKGVGAVFAAPKVAFDSADFEEKQVFFDSKDGTRIPMLLAYRKGLKLDGQNPLLLYGYGGFGISVLPAFSSSRIAWMERGGIYAIANIRGGGEYGEAWHRQGTLTHKQNVFDDFIAAAEWLIAEGYTSTPKLAIQGGSNGGLLVGACVTQRPDLFGAAIASVGVMDMLRFNKFGQGAGWEGDYGSPDDPEQFAALRAYSPVHNVKDGTRYPATMIITGDHDTRVMPMHSFKFAAALQTAQTSSAPILLRVELGSGHGGGTTVTQAIDQNADIDAFLIENLGMKERPRELRAP